MGDQMTSPHQKRSRLTIGWRVNQGLDPEYWMRPDATRGAHTPEDLVEVEASAAAKHTAVIAQSGSGKSFFLGRLLEEIALKTQARVVILELELTPFHGHRIVQQQGVQDAQTAYPQAAVLGAISRAIGRARPSRAQPQ